MQDVLLKMMSPIFASTVSRQQLILTTARYSLMLETSAPELSNLACLPERTRGVITFGDYPDHSGLWSLLLLLAPMLRAIKGIT